MPFLSAQSLLNIFFLFTIIVFVNHEENRDILVLTFRFTNHPQMQLVTSRYTYA